MANLSKIVNFHKLRFVIAATPLKRHTGFTGLALSENDDIIIVLRNLFQ